MPASKGFFYFNHGPHLHEYLEEFNRDVFSKYDCMTLAEAPMVTPKKALKYMLNKAKVILYGGVVLFAFAILQLMYNLIFRHI